MLDVFCRCSRETFLSSYARFPPAVGSNWRSVLKIEFSSVFKRIFTFQFGSSAITPSKTARNLGVVIDDKLNFTDHITKTARSCRFALYNIKKTRPFLWEHTTQLLVQALVIGGVWGGPGGALPPQIRPNRFCQIYKYKNIFTLSHFICIIVF